jgi:uncharacterized protein (TIRG00374 family)
MSEQSFFSRHWKLILNLITLALLAGLIVASRHQLAQTVNNFRHVHAWAILLMIPIEIVNYHAQTRLYQRLFGIVGNKLSYKFLLKASIELNFVNHVFPSGGVSGISYFGSRLRNEEITGAKATVVQVMKLGLTFLSFELLLVVGLVSLAVMGRVNNLTVLVAAVLSTLLFVGTALFAYIIGSRSRIDTTFTLATKILNRIIQVVRPSHPETINIERARGSFMDLHHNYKEFESKYKQLKGPFWWAFLMNISEVLAVYVVFVAFGHWVNLGAVILAYAVANFAGLVSVLPGGIGVYEGLMTAILATGGVRASLSLPVVIMYRVVNTLIQIPPGYYLYHKHLNAHAPESSKA